MVTEIHSEELALKVFQLSIPHSCLARRIDFVTDTYPEFPIKDAERTNRAKEGVIKIKISGGDQKCPKQWKKFLSCGDNKSELVLFMLKEWSADKYKSLIGNRRIFFDVGLKCYCLSVRNDQVISEEILQLCSNHEEADTKLLLHTKHAAEQGETTIIIKSQVTDVAILACHFEDQIPARILLMKKLKTRVVHLDVSLISEEAGPLLCNALPGIHAFTGCDTTSSFSGKGKKAPFLLCTNNTQYCEAMSMLGDEFDVDDRLYSKCEQFVCGIYGNPKEKNVNHCRYLMFSSKQSLSHCLPPCQDSLKMHIKRANYQAAIWRRALDPNPRCHFKAICRS